MSALAVCQERELATSRGLMFDAGRQHPEGATIRFHVDPPVR